MTETSTPDEIPFRPARPFRMPWASVLVWGAAGIGATLALLGALVLAGAAPGGLSGLAPSRGMDLFAIAFLVAAGPVAFRYGAARKRRLKLDERLPDLLTDLAALHKAGLTLPESIVTAREGDYGPLTPEVRMAADQIRWDIPALTALENLKDRIGTPIAERTLTVIIEAGRTGGNLPEVIDIAAANARSFVQLREMRARQMGLYTLIIYVASAVFIGVTLALQFVFVPKMLTAFGGGTGAGLGLASGLPSLDEFRGLFYGAALVQATGNGLVGGLMTEGRTLAGLRHAWYIVAATAVAFAVG